MLQDDTTSVDFIVEVEPTDFLTNDGNQGDHAKPATAKHKATGISSNFNRLRRILPKTEGISVQPSPNKQLEMLQRSLSSSVNDVRQQHPHASSSSSGQVIIPVTVRTPCELCGQIIVASRFQELKDHVCSSSMPKQQQHGGFSCSESDCAKVMPSAQALKHHIKYVHSMIKQKAKVAGNATPSASGGGGGRFACSRVGCGKSYRHRSYLVEHERVHSGERPFSCQNCSRSFYRILDLKKHKLLKVCL